MGRQPGISEASARCIRERGGKHVSGKELEERIGGSLHPANTHLDIKSAFDFTWPCTERPPGADLRYQQTGQPAGFGPKCEYSDRICTRLDQLSAQAGAHGNWDGPTP